MSLVHTEALAACPFSVAQYYAEEYLRRAELNGAEAEIRVPLRLFGWRVMPRRKARMRFSLRYDLSERGRAHEEIVLVWVSQSPLLPDFHGVVHMRIAQLQTRLVLDGQYVPPGGAVGRLFDALVGRHVARASTADFLARLASYLEGREREWRPGARADVVSGSR